MATMTNRNYGVGRGIRAPALVGLWGLAVLIGDTAVRGQEAKPPDKPFELPPGIPVAGAGGSEAARYIRLGQARERYQVNGRGLAVVVIDTGINPVHISFQGQLLPGKNFSTDGSETDTTDRDGHGSNIAGIIAAKAIDLGEGMPTGIAPEAKIIPLKVFPGGQFEKINAALQWVLDNRDRYEADHHVTISVVNMSLGSSENLQSLPDDLAGPLKTERSLIKQLRDKHVAVTAPAGNDYKETAPEEGMGFPAICPETVSVGAVFDRNLGPAPDGQPLTQWSSGALIRFTRIDRCLPFTQRLSEERGGSARTDLFAPGFLVASAGPIVPAGSGQDPTRTRTTDDGTAQATAMVAGAILLIQQRYRELTRSFGDPKDSLPDVNLIEDVLRQGGVKFQDAEDEIGRQMDNVPSCGRTFVRLDVLGALNNLQQRYEQDLEKVHTQLLYQSRGGQKGPPRAPKGARILGKAIER
jgi:subtilisin family serine protease